MLLRGFIQYAPSLIAPRLAMFLLIVILSARLGGHEFGYYSLALLVGETLDLSISVWTRYSMLRLDGAKPKSWRSALSRTLLLTLGCIVAAVAVIIPTSLAMAPDRVLWFGVAVSVYFIANALLRLALTLLQMQRRSLEYSAVETLRAGAMIAAAMALSAGAHPDFAKVVIGVSLVTLTCAAATFALAALRLPPDEEAAFGYKERIVFGAPIVTMLLISSAVTASDRIILKALSGAEAVGIYAAAYALARTPIDLVANIVNQVAFPELVTRYDRDGADAAQHLAEQALALMSLLLFGTTGMVWGLSAAIGEALLPPAFHQIMAQAGPVIALASCLYCLKAFAFDNVFNLVRRNWLQNATYAPAGIVTIVACAGLTPIFGSLGAAMGFFFGAAAGLATSVVVTSRILFIPWPLAEFAKSLLAAFAAGICAHFTAAALHASPPFLALVAGGCVGALVWAGAVLALRPAALDDLFARLAPASAS